MNRVVLCGCLTDRPRWATTPCGIAIVHLRLQVRRPGLLAPQDEQNDDIDCLALHDLARRLIVLGEPGLRLNLEGRLFTARLRDERGQPRHGCHVYVERADIVEPLPPPRVFRGIPAPADPGESADNDEAP